MYSAAPPALLGTRCHYAIEQFDEKQKMLRVFSVPMSVRPIMVPIRQEPARSVTQRGFLAQGRTRNVWRRRPCQSPSASVKLAQTHRRAKHKKVAHTLRLIGSPEEKWENRANTVQLQLKTSKQHKT